MNEQQNDWTVVPKTARQILDCEKALETAIDKQLEKLKEESQPLTADVVYLSGPMRGYRWYNFPAFDTAAWILKSYGYSVISPAEWDREEGFNPFLLPETTDWNEFPETHSKFVEVAKRDLLLVCAANTIAMLPGWEDSMGATAELAVAKWLGLNVIYMADNFGFIKVEHAQEPEKSILEEAQAITNDSVQYGPIEQNLEHIAALWSTCFGWKVKSWHVAVAMIQLKIVRQLNNPKRDNWTDIAGYARGGSRCDKTGV